MIVASAFSLLLLVALILQCCVCSTELTIVKRPGRIKKPVNQVKDLLRELGKINDKTTAKNFVSKFPTKFPPARYPLFYKVGDASTFAEFLRRNHAAIEQLNGFARMILLRGFALFRMTSFRAQRAVSKFSRNTGAGRSDYVLWIRANIGECPRLSKAFNEDWIEKNKHIFAITVPVLEDDFEGSTNDLLEDNLPKGDSTTNKVNFRDGSVENDSDDSEIDGNEDDSEGEKDDEEEDSESVSSKAIQRKVLEGLKEDGRSSDELDPKNEKSDHTSLEEKLGYKDDNSHNDSSSDVDAPGVELGAESSSIIDDTGVKGNVDDGKETDDETEQSNGHLVESNRNGLNNLDEESADNVTRNKSQSNASVKKISKLIDVTSLEKVVEGRKKKSNDSKENSKENAEENSEESSEENFDVNSKQSSNDSNSSISTSSTEILDATKYFFVPKDINGPQLKYLNEEEAFLASYQRMIKLRRQSKYYRVERSSLPKYPRNENELAWLKRIFNL